MIKIKNIDSVSHEWGGIEIEPDSLYEVDTQKEKSLLCGDQVFISDYEADKAEIYLDDYLVADKEKALLIVCGEYRPTCAMDLDNTNVEIESDEWSLLEANRIIWDVHSDYDDANSNFDVTMNGVYSFDIQLRVTSFVNVESVEIAIFKRGSSDDYWFILDKRQVNNSTLIQLNGNTQFDFYSGESYCLKIKVTKADNLLPCSMTIIGDDDYSAWGYSMVRHL